MDSSPPSPAPVKPKLVLKKSDLPPAVRVVKKESGSCLGRLAGLLVVIACAAGSIYYFRDRIDWEKIPVPGLRAWVESLDAPSGKKQPADASVAPAVASAPPDAAPEDFSRNEDFRTGARLFNEALAAYKNYQETRENPAELRVVEDKCRQAIAHFEACKSKAPAHIDIAGYIHQCNGLIANVRQSSGVDFSGTGEASQAGSSTSGAIAPGPASTAPRIEITYIDPPPRAETSRPKVQFVDDEIPAEPTAPVSTNELRRLAFDPAWNRSSPDAGGIAGELRAILKPRASPSSVLAVDPGISLYTGITAMMSAREAARQLGQALGVKRPVNTPGLPFNSMFAYTFDGNYSGARRLTLVVDRNDRAIMVQLYDDRPAPARLKSLYSTRWNVVDFLDPQLRTGNDPLIAHQARANGAIVIVDSEKAAGVTGDSMPANASVRIRWIMPSALAGLIISMDATP